MSSLRWHVLFSVLSTFHCSPFFDRMRFSVCFPTIYKQHSRKKNNKKTHQQIYIKIWPRFIKCSAWLSAVRKFVLLPHHNPYFRCSFWTIKKSDTRHNREKKHNIFGTRHEYSFCHGNNYDYCYYFIYDLSILTLSKKKKEKEMENKVAMVSTGAELHLTTTLTFTNAGQQHFCVCLFIRIGCG